MAYLTILSILFLHEIFPTSTSGQLGNLTVACVMCGCVQTFCFGVHVFFLICANLFLVCICFFSKPGESIVAFRLGAGEAATMLENYFSVL